MRLIDGDNQATQLTSYIQEHKEAFLLALENRDMDYILALTMEYFDNQPTAYDVDKVVEKLEKQAEQERERGFEIEQKGFSSIADKYYGKQCSYEYAIEVVKAGVVNE